MKIPETESEQILVCNAAREYASSGSFSDAYNVCKTAEDEKTITKYKESIEAFSERLVDARIARMGKLKSY